MVSGRRASGMKNSSANVEQTFQFAPAPAKRPLREHEQTGKFALPARSVFIVTGCRYAT
jgi:hypothetical protein